MLDIHRDALKGVAHEFLGNIQHVQKTFAGVFFNVFERHVQRHAEGGALGLVRKSIHCGCHNSNSLISETLRVFYLSTGSARRFPNFYKKYSI